MSTHRINIGDITCTVVAEGEVESDISSIAQRFPNASEEEIQDALDKLGITGDKVSNYYNALLIETDDTKILVDAGMGQNPERPQVGQVVPNLASVGVQAEDIDIVYITHFHGDHYMGLLTNGEPTFPNARYVTLDTEWNYWLSDDAQEKFGDRVKGILSVVDPLRDKFITVSAGDEIASGVRVMTLAGHTMGQSGLLIESGNDALLHLVDVLHHPSQFLYPDWQFVWDTDAELAVRTRRAQLANAINRNMLVMFYHLPFPGLGHVQRDGQHYQWIPLSN